jgi:hypothetical protein
MKYIPLWNNEDGNLITREVGVEVSYFLFMNFFIPTDLLIAATCRCIACFLGLPGEFYPW